MRLLASILGVKIHEYMGTVLLSITIKPNNQRPEVEFMPLLLAISRAGDLARVKILQILNAAHNETDTKPA